MSTPSKPVQLVRNLLGAMPAGKRLLLVEGPDDKSIYSVWLKRLAHPQLLSAKLDIQDVGGKSPVLNTLEWFRDNEGNPAHLFGIVDRGEWVAAALAAATAALPQLRVAADRDCLESYFADPDELEPSLKAEDAGYAAQLPAFRGRLEAARGERVDHWALFTTTERVKERMTAAYYPGAFHAAMPIPADADIVSRFQIWAGLVAHPQLFDEFAALRAQVHAAAAGTQFRSHICAKPFFKDVVYPAPEGLQRFRAKSEIAWLLDLAERSPIIPADIAAILQPLVT